MTKLTKDDVPTDTFFVSIEPIDSSVPPFKAKATKIADPAQPPPIIIVIPPVEPDPPGPPGPDWTPVWLWQPETQQWVFCYQRISGVEPKAADATDPCVMPSPPGWSLEWGFSIEMDGWIQGYKRIDGWGPKMAQRKAR